MPDPSPSNADSLKLQPLTARNKEWWPATADSLPPGGFLSAVIYRHRAHNLNSRLLVRRATSRATETITVADRIHTLNELLVTMR